MQQDVHSPPLAQNQISPPKPKIPNESIAQLAKILAKVHDHLEDIWMEIEQEKLKFMIPLCEGHK